MHSVMAVRSITGRFSTSGRTRPMSPGPTTLTSACSAYFRTEGDGSASLAANAFVASDSSSSAAGWAGGFVACAWSSPRAAAAETIRSGSPPLTLEL